MEVIFDAIGVGGGVVNGRDLGTLVSVDVVIVVVAIPVVVVVVIIDMPSVRFLTPRVECAGNRCRYQGSALPAGNSADTTPSVFVDPSAFLLFVKGR